MMMGSLVSPRTTAGAKPLPNAAAAPDPATVRKFRRVSVVRRLFIGSSFVGGEGDPAHITRARKVSTSNCAELKEIRIYGTPEGPKARILPSAERQNLRPLRAYNVA